jgi:hypothetical protein
MRLHGDFRADAAWLAHGQGDRQWRSTLHGGRQRPWAPGAGAASGVG